MREVKSEPRPGGSGRGREVVEKLAGPSDNERYSQAAPKKEVRDANYYRELKSRKAASARTTDLRRIARFMIQHGLVFDVRLLIDHFAQARASTTSGRIPVKRLGDLNSTHARPWIRYLGEDDLYAGVQDDLRSVRVEASMETIEAVCREVESRNIQRRSSSFADSEAVAHAFGVSSEMRAELELRTVGCNDKSKEQRLAETAEKKRAADRQRAERKRRAAGVKPKAAIALKDAKPWVSLGISRATWFRRQSGEIPLRE